MKKYLFFACGCAFLIGMIIALYKMFEINSEDKTSAILYSQLSGYVEIAPSKNEAESQSDTLTEGGGFDADNFMNERTMQAYQVNFPVVDFEDLSEINHELVGWLYIEGTPINYPLVQGEDNEYYLKHLFDRTYSNYGCLFLDWRNNPSFTDRNTIIYGHHMKNDTMFSSLALYKQQEYFNIHPVAMIVTPKSNYLLHFFSGYVADTDDTAWETNLSSDAAFDRWLQDIAGRSLFQSNIMPTVQDRIVTLSTCSYEFDNARFVLFGVVEEYPRKGET